MSEEWRSISDSPCTIHSATDLPTPGPSLIQTAAADHRPLTSGVSPRIGMPSGVSESRPLIAYFTPTRLVADDLRHQLERVLHLRLEVGLGERQLGRATARPPRSTGSRRGRAGSAGGRRSRSRGRCRPGARTCWCPCRGRSGTRSCPWRSANRGTGPMSIIWCTAGVSGIDAPAMRAIRGLQTPQAMTTTSRPRCRRAVVRTRRTRPCSTSMPEHLDVGGDGQRARLGARARA